MPLDQLLVFRPDRGRSSPFGKWLSDLKTNEPSAYKKCLYVISYLIQSGPTGLAMPNAKLLRDGIWELRTRAGKVRYRILFFICWKNIACISHGFKKGGRGSSEDPNNEEIEIAIHRRQLVIADRDR